MITGCQQDIEAINVLLVKTLPLANDSLMTRAKKAAQSIRQEKAIERITKSLSDYLAVLVLHSTAKSVTGKLHTEAASEGFMVPFERDSAYIERTEVIQRMDNVLHDQRRVVLAGAGGVGKSQIAIEHCYRFQEQHVHSHVFWIHASTIERALGDWNQMARHLAIPGLDEPEADVLQITREFLSGKVQMPWLLVLDNVDDADILFHIPTPDAAQTTQFRKNIVSALPISKTGTILVTTRDRRIGEKLLGNKATITVPTFGLDDAKSLLRSRLSSFDWDEDAASNLVTELDCLPLAVNQAAAFISENNMLISEYLIGLQGEGDEIRTLLDQETYDVRRDQEMQAPVLRTWRLSFDLIAKQKPRASELLGLMAVLDRQGIPKCLLERTGESPVELYLALGVLQAFSIISVEKGGTTFGMHRLSQLATQAWLGESRKTEQYQVEALGALRDKFPNYGDWQVCDAMMPHAQVVLRYVYTSKTAQLQVAALLRYVALYDNERGRFQIARQRLYRALEINEGIYGAHHLDLVDFQTDLAHVLSEQADYKSAELLYRSANVILYENLGPEHRSTLNGLDNLGGSFYLQGRYREMKDVLQQGLDSALASIGEADPVTTRLLLNLAVAHDKLGDFENANRVYQQVLSIQSTRTGDQDPEAYSGKSEYADFLGRHGRHIQAERIYREVWAAQSESLGPTHYITINSLSALFGSLFWQGKYEEAESLARRALQLRRDSLPSDHPDTLKSMQKLANVIKELGKFDEAEQLYREVMQISSQMWGLEHPDTVEVMEEQARLLCAQKRYEASEDLYRRVLDIESRLRGPHQPSTIASMNLLAGTLFAQGKSDEAMDLQRQVLAAREEAQGADHPDTLLSMDYVIGSAWSQGHLEEATKVLRRALMLRKQRFGEKAPETLIRMTRLAYLLKIQGMTEESLGLYQRALTLYEQTLGEHSELTKKCATCVADLLAEKMASTAM